MTADARPEAGLSSVEALRRLAHDGPNDPASVVSTFVGQLVNAGTVIVIVSLSVTENFAQTFFRSQRATNRLRATVAPTATVLRDGVHRVAVMAASPHTIGVDQTLARAHEMMRAHRLRHLPILDGGRLVGILSQRDLYFVEAIAGVDRRVVLRLAGVDARVCPACRQPVRLRRREAHRRRGGEDGVRRNVDHEGPGRSPGLDRRRFEVGWKRRSKRRRHSWAWGSSCTEEPWQVHHPPLSRNASRRPSSRIRDVDVAVRSFMLPAMAQQTTTKRQFER